MALHDAETGYRLANRLVVIDREGRARRPPGALPLDAFARATRPSSRRPPAEVPMTRLWAVFRKDLAIELRTRTRSTPCSFGVVVLVVFHFALRSGDVDPRAAAPGPLSPSPSRGRWGSTGCSPWRRKTAAWKG